MTHAQMFTADAHLVDCELVRLRKTEVNFSSPADLKKIFGSGAFDESNISIPLKELLISHSKFAAAMEDNVHAAAKIPPEKLPRRPGGRKRLDLEDKSFSRLGRAVEQEFPRCERGFELRRRFTNGGILDLNALRKEMKKKRFSQVEIESMLIKRTPMGAAKYVVARQLSSEKKPNGLSLRTVHSAHSRYLRSKYPSV